MVLSSGDQGDFPRVNLRQKRQWLCFTIEGLNSFGTVLFFYYLYFLLRSRFGFDDKHNLAVAALLGLIYAVASWQAGRFAHRFGYFTSLKLGFGTMLAALVVGSQAGSAAGVIIFACIANVGMCFTWPVLEALVRENETPDGLSRAVGIYNITWAATNALGYFIGGTLIVKFGFESIFYIPAALLVGQLALTFWLEKISSGTNIPPVQPQPKIEGKAGPVLDSQDACPTTPALAKTFLHMAWL